MPGRPGGLLGTGLVLLPRRGLRSLALATGLGLAFGTWMALADATLFAAAVPQVQVDLNARIGPVIRIPIYALGAIKDEIVLRLLAMTLLVWLLDRLGLDERRRHWAAILLIALVIYPFSAWSYMAALDWSGLTVARELALHAAAGTLWGWLYWRHGWLAGVTGHVAAHVALQPLLSLT